jgi:hypothetical protein
MLLAPRTEARFEYRVLAGCGQAEPQGQHFDAVYDDEDEARAQYASYLAKRNVQIS